MAGIVALLAIAVVLFLVFRPGSGGSGGSGDTSESAGATSTTSSSSSSSSSSPKPSSTKPTLPDYTTTGRFERMDKGTPVRGTKGELFTYRVEVEDGTGIGVNSFAKAVDKTLSHKRGWTGDGKFRFQRVTDEEPDLTIKLATPETVDKACAEVGLDTEGFLSCRSDGAVNINLNRWAVGVKHIRDLAVYRNYVINHEVGHILGRSHEACTGEGKPAPLMMQQTKELDGCTANGWPYAKDGTEVTGPPSD